MIIMVQFIKLLKLWHFSRFFPILIGIAIFFSRSLYLYLKCITKKEIDFCVGSGSVFAFELVSLAHAYAYAYRSPQKTHLINSNECQSQSIQSLCALVRVELCKL